MGFAGGIIGECQNSISQNSTILNNVYNVGTVTCDTSLVGRIGGLIGAVAGNVTIENSYNAGTVSGGSTYGGTYSGAIVGSLVVGKVLNSSNLYYLDSSSSKDCGSSTITGVTSKTDAELKDSGMPGLLNASQNPAPWYRKDGVNNGWPILRMGIAVPEMTVTPESLSIVYGSTGTITYTYNGDGDITAVSSAIGVCTVTVNVTAKTVTVSTIAVGSSVVTISAAETDSYEAISKTVAVNVTRKPIAVPPAITGLVYNGYEQTGVNAGAEYTITGNTATNAGSYIAYATPNGNYMWTDTTITAKGIGWSIGRLGIARPVAADRIYNRAWQEGVAGGVGYNLSGNPTAIDQGVYGVTATLDSNYQWADGSIDALSLIWTMYRKDISNDDVIKSIGTETRTYNGTAHTQDISLSHAGAVLVNPTEYTVAYSDNINAGTATITVTGIGNYTGTVISYFTIGRLGIARPVAIDRTYNRGWQEGVAGGVGYYLSGNPTAIDQGVYGVTATLDPNYQWADGSVEALSLTWTMYRKDISNDDVIKSIGAETRTYNGTAHTQDISLSHAGAVLVNPTEYTVTYTDNVNAGTATITVTGIGNYTGTVISYFTIGRLGIARPVAIDRTYNRGWQEGVAGGVGYYLSGNPTAIDQGVYGVTATLDPNYQWADGSVEALSLSWTMYRKDISNDDVIKSIGTETRTYNGTAHTQDISLSHAGAVLVNPTEYTVAYTDNINAGIVTITITGQGNYIGTVTSTFIINRANQTITLSDKTIDYNPNNVPVPIGDATVTGVNGTVLNVTVTYTYYTNSACTTQTTTADGAAGNGQAPAYVGVYYVVASVAESQNYNATSKTVILTINKIANTLVITGVPNLRYIEAPQNLVTVSTPQGDVYYLIGNTALNSSNYTSGTTKNTIPQGTNAGTYVVQYYTPGTRNYKEKTGSVTVVIIDTYYKDNASPVKYYVSLQEAFSQIETGKTLLVMKNVADNTPATLPANKTLTLELNGKTITASKTGMTATFTFIVNNGTLTLQDNSSGKTGTINVTGETTATEMYTRLVSNYGTITIKSGKYNVQSSSTAWVIGIDAQGESSAINIEGGSLISTGTTNKNTGVYGISATNGTTNIRSTTVIEAKNSTTTTEWIAGIYANGEGKSTVNITGGTIKGNTGIFFSASYTNAGSTLNVSGTDTKIEGVVDGIRNIRATGGFTINGGTITGGRYGIYQTVNNNITTSGNIIGGTNAGIRIDSGTLTIRGGSITSEGSSAVKSYDTAKIIVGTQGGGEPSKTNPLIQGKDYGIEAINGFNFYDGILKGTVDAFNGNVTPETNYIIYYGKEVISGVQYRTATLIRDTIEIPTSGKPVITEWKIPAKLDSNGKTTTIKIPIPANAKAYKVDWGDSVVEFVDAGVGFKEHLYKNTAEQTYTIKASGYIDTFGYYSEAVPTKDNVYKDYYDFTQYVTAIKDWGVIEAKRYGFSNCTKLNSTIPSLKKVSFKNITDISLLFNNCSGLDIELQKDLFSDCTHLQYFNSTFNGCSKLKGTLPRELFASNTDVRKIARIFKGCSSLVGADISIDSNNITTMDEMFSGCTNIKTIVFEEKFKDLVGIKMFEGCNNLKSIVMLYEYSG